MAIPARSRLEIRVLSDLAAQDSFKNLHFLFKVSAERRGEAAQVNHVHTRHASANVVDPRPDRPQFSVKDPDFPSRHVTHGSTSNQLLICQELIKLTSYHISRIFNATIKPLFSVSDTTTSGMASGLVSWRAGAEADLNNRLPNHRFLKTEKNNHKLKKLEIEREEIK